jgi:hypothetical protein
VTPKLSRHRWHSSLPLREFDRKRYELPRPPGSYDRVLKRVGIQY